MVWQDRIDGALDLYVSGYDALVDAFVRKEIDLAWNGPLSYVKMKRLVNDACQNVVMRDVDVNFRTQFITLPDSDITSVTDPLGKRVALGRRSSWAMNTSSRLKLRP